MNIPKVYVSVKQPDLRLVLFKKKVRVIPVELSICAMELKLGLLLELMNQ